MNYNPHKTAISRSAPGPVTRWVLEHHGRPGVTMLDYGCGRFKEKKVYDEVGMDAEGYDPYPGFGFTDHPWGVYDVVVCSYVVNVIPDVGERFDVVKRAMSHVKDGGDFLLVARSYYDVVKHAARNGWERHRDGFWSSKERGMFQAGMHHHDMKFFCSMNTEFIHIDDPDFGSHAVAVLYRRHAKRTNLKEMMHDGLPFLAVEQT